MTRGPVLLAFPPLLVLLLGASGTPPAAPPPERPPVPAPSSTPVAFFPVESIRPGMMGIARTVFEGERLEEFGVEFLGVLKNAIGPQQDMIVARLRGEHVEFTGVVSGMSGSPVYIDGKLVGAISYRLGSFAKEAIAGITPIGEMVKLIGTEPRAARGGDHAADPLAWLTRGTDGTPPAPRPAAAPTVEVAGMGGFEPIATPLVCSGCDPEVLRRYAPAFEVMGLTPTAGGGSMGSSAMTPPRPLLPGTAIGAALATGDLSLAGIGTLTHVDGRHVFAFGHPMLGVGATELPMTQAEVLLTFASSAGSFKIANATEPIGTIVEDRLTAIVGEVGRVPPMLPFTVRIHSGGKERVFHYGVVRDRSWAPLVVALTAANSLVRTTEFDTADTLALRYRIDIEGYPEVRYEELYAGTNPSQPVHTLLANDAGGLLSLLCNNPFENVAVRSAEADIDLLEPSQVAALTALSASRSEVRPGEPFRVSAVLSPFRGKDRTVTFELALPEDTSPGEVQIIVGGGSFLDQIDRRVQERQLMQAADLKDVLRIVGRQRPSHALYLRVARRAPSAIVRSELLPDLPLTIFNVFNNPRLSADATLLVEAPVMEESRDLDLVASGGRRITLKVR